MWYFSSVGKLLCLAIAQSQILAKRKELEALKGVSSGLIGPKEALISSGKLAFILLFPRLRKSQ